MIINGKEISIQEYIDENATNRMIAHKHILEVIDQCSLKPPQFVEDADKYGVMFDGFTINRFKPWLELDYKTALSKDRLFVIKQFAESAPEGLCYECGVYTGGVTRMLLDIGKHVVAFDTFEGIKGAGSEDLFANGAYNGGEVFDYISGAEIIVGEIPFSFDGRNDEIAFAHLDMDVYSPTKAALEYIWPRLVSGGVVVLDDYGFWVTPGIRKAADEFDHGRKIYLPTGQMVIIK